MGAGLFRDSYAQWRSNPISDKCDIVWPFADACHPTGTCVESGIPNLGVCLCSSSWVDPSAIVSLLSDATWSTCTIPVPLYLTIHLIGFIFSIILSARAINKFKRVMEYAAIKAIARTDDIVENPLIREYLESFPVFRSEFHRRDQHGAAEGGETAAGDKVCETFLLETCVFCHS